MTTHPPGGDIAEIPPYRVFLAAARSLTPAQRHLLAVLAGPYPAVGADVLVGNFTLDRLASTLGSTPKPTKAILADLHYRGWWWQAEGQHGNGAVSDLLWPLRPVGNEAALYLKRPVVLAATEAKRATRHQQLETQLRHELNQHRNALFSEDDHKIRQKYLDGLDNLGLAQDLLDFRRTSTAEF